MAEQRHELYCIECREWYDEVFFEITNSSWGKNTYPKKRKLRCIGCRLSRRTREKNEGKRFLVKARGTLMHHARTLGISAADLTERFGWRLEQMAHDIEHNFKNGCPYCREAFAGMPNGLGDVTLDIVNTEEPPYYNINTRWACMTCNRSKGKTPPNLWAIKLLCWAKWRARQTKLKVNRWVGTLFEGWE